MVDLVVRDASRNAVAIVASVSESYAIELVSEWIHAGAVGDALTVEVVRSLPQLQLVGVTA